MPIFPNFHKKFGDVFDSNPATEDVIKKYKDRIPEQLIQLWKEDGWGGYADGLIWTINPAKYQEVIPNWLEIAADGVPFLITCFGDILVWEDKTMGETIEMIDIRYCQSDIIDKDISEMFETSFCHDVYLYYSLRAKAFPEIMKKLGILKNDECYGYEPALILGGDETIANLRVVKFDIYLNIITQMLEGPVD